MKHNTRLGKIEKLSDDAELICPVCHAVFDKEMAIDFDGLGCCAKDGLMTELLVLKN